MNSCQGRSSNLFSTLPASLFSGLSLLGVGSGMGGSGSLLLQCLPIVSLPHFLLENLASSASVKLCVHGRHESPVTISFLVLTTTRAYQVILSAILVLRLYA